jgi:uncharacterized protein (DUF433 family)
MTYPKEHIMKELSAYISLDPDIRFGKPCIKGTRISVGDILQWLSAGMTTQDILDDYPELQEIHIRAVLTFAAARDTITKVFVHEAVA